MKGLKKLAEKSGFQILFYLPAKLNVHTQQNQIDAVLVSYLRYDVFVITLLNAAVTVLLDVIIKLQELFPVHAPDQPAK